jgi:hypothetical protein
MLPRRIPKAPKRASRWRSQAHCNFVRGFACSVPGCDGRPIEVAHVRLGSGAGMAQKPDDWRAVSLCRRHHAMQHNEGEATFWLMTAALDAEKLISEFIKASPKRHEIQQVQRKREASLTSAPDAAHG